MIIKNKCNKRNVRITQPIDYQRSLGKFMQSDGVDYRMNQLVASLFSHLEKKRAQMVTERHNQYSSGSITQQHSCYIYISIRSIPRSQRCSSSNTLGSFSTKKVYIKQFTQHFSISILAQRFLRKCEDTYFILQNK